MNLKPAAIAIGLALSGCAKSPEVHSPMEEMRHLDEDTKQRVRFAALGVMCPSLDFGITNTEPSSDEPILVNQLSEEELKIAAAIQECLLNIVKN